MDGLGVSQQMQVKFEMSATSGPGGFSVCVCTRTCMRVFACVRGRKEGLGGLGAGGLRLGVAALRGWRTAAAGARPLRSCPHVLPHLAPKQPSRQGESLLFHRRKQRPQEAFAPEIRA